MKKLTLSATTIQLFLECRHKYFLTNVLQLGTGKRELAQEFGTGLHKAIDSLHQEGWDAKKAKEVFDGSFVEDPEDTKRTRATAHTIIERYYLAYKDQPLRVVHQGFSFRLAVPEFPQVEIVGEIDRVVDWSGRIMVDEFKSTSQLTADYMKRFWFDYQTSMYLIAARKLVDPKINAILADAALVAKSDPKTLKSSPLLRDIIERTDEQITYTRARLLQIIGEIVFCHQEWEEKGLDYWYENDGSCTNFGGCKFLSYCREAPSTREKIREMDFVQQPLHVEESRFNESQTSKGEF